MDCLVERLAKVLLVFCQLFLGQRKGYLEGGKYLWYAVVTGLKVSPGVQELVA